MSLLSMIQGLTDAGVRFVVIGGVAARAHGSVRITEDLDVCYDPAPDNRERLADLLAAWQGYPRAVDPGRPFVMDARTIETSPILTLSTAHGALDLFDVVPGVGDYEAVRQRSVSVDGGSVHFLALTLEALIEAKRATKRPRDLAQLPELEALRELSQEDREAR